MDRLRVLLVDDEDELVFTLEERLRLRGFDAEGVTSGAEALKRINDREYDVVLLDVKMPGIGGLETMKRIKGECPDLEIILFTGHGSIKDGEEGMRHGAFAYLMKPVNIEDLAKKIREAAKC